MLQSIYVKNFILFDELELNLKKGLTVFTGETGAGKSLLIEAFSLLCGKQASSESIRVGENYAIIEGVLKVDFTKISDDIKPFVENNCLTITRKISRDRSSVVRLNGQSITLKQLKLLMRDYVSIVGQHDYMYLCDDNVQLSLLDSQNKEIANALISYQKYYEEHMTIQDQINSFQEQAVALARDLDLARFQYDELSSQHFLPSEDIKLKDIKHKLKSLKKEQTLYLQLTDKFKDLYHSSQETLPLLKSLNDDDLNLKMMSFVENNILYLSDYISDCEGKKQSFDDMSDIDIDELESRLDVIFKFKKKYNVNSVDELNLLQDKLAKQLDAVTQSEDVVSDLEKLRLDNKEKLSYYADLLDSLRRSCIVSFEQLVNDALKKLNISYPQFMVDLGCNKDFFGKNGSNTIQFNVSTNPGQPSRSLKAVASGGELSRILLAIQSQSPNVSVIPTLLYDEIDTGVGGVTANSVGDYLSRISEYQQIIVVTHLPQVAQFASTHFLIDKIANKHSTEIMVSQLDKKAHKVELGRMLGGKTVINALTL